MASTRFDFEKSKIIIRCYAGINPSTGKEHSISKTLPIDATDEQIKAAEAELEARAAVTKKNSKVMTVEAAVKYYLDGCSISDMSVTTLSSYKSYARCHVYPRIGKILFEKADSYTFSCFYRDLRRSQADGGAGLSAATVQKIHAFLSGCFSTLKSDGVIDVNPLIDVKVPQGKLKEAKPLMPQDFTKLMIYLIDEMSITVEDDASFLRYSFAVLVYVDLHTGMRRGELAGLLTKHFLPPNAQRENFAFRVAETLVQVRNGKTGDSYTVKPPKSATSKRNITIDDVTASAVNSYIEIRDLVLADHRIIATENTPIFCDPYGNYLKPSYITERFREVVKLLDLDRSIHLHSLRHTHASYLIDEGENLLTIQERFGHATFQVTMDRYGHLLPSRDARAAESFAKVAKAMSEKAQEVQKAIYIPRCPLTDKPCARFEKE